MERRREDLLFPHNNRGMHGHPSPHQSTERDGGMEGWSQMSRGMEEKECMTAEVKSDVQREGEERKRGGWVCVCERRD